MNKNIVLLLLAIPFLFSGCKKEKENTVSDSGIKLLAYTIQQTHSSSTTGYSTYKLSGSIIAPTTFKMTDHGFILKGTYPLQIIRLGSYNSIGLVEASDSLSIDIPVFPDSLVFYVVLPNGDSIRSDKGVIFAQGSFSTFTISNFNIADSGSYKTQLTLSYTYNPNIYQIGPQILYYRINSKSPWTDSGTVLPQSNAISSYDIVATNPLVTIGSPYDFQVVVTLIPISGSGSPSIGTSSVINSTYY
jgi:hypothetical protein